MTQPIVDLGIANLLDEELPDEPAAGKKTTKKASAKPVEDKVRIVLEDNDQIPPGGQFIQVGSGDGPTRSFLLQPGVEVDVPRCVVDVLDHAVMSVPLKDSSDTVIGYKDRLRFPYRVCTASRRAD